MTTKNRFKLTFQRGRVQVRAQVALLAVTAILFCTPQLLAQQCPAIANIDTKLKYNDEPIKAWRYGNLATVVLVPGVNVNVDGSPRAYSVGNKGLASILNGVDILDNGTYTSWDAYKNLYGKYFTDLWLEAERQNFAVGTRQFRAFALYVRDGDSIVGNGQGVPKTQRVAGETIPYYISTTNFGQAAFPENDQRHYLDSGAIPAFVVPKQGNFPDPLKQFLDVRQLAWAYYPETSRATFAIGGDTGPAKKFSEATIAFHQLLRFGKVLPIPTYKADGRYVSCQVENISAESICLYMPFYQRRNGNNVKTDELRINNLGTTIYLFFNKDVKATDGTVTREIINNKGQAALENIGGLGNVRNCLKRMPELVGLLRNLN